jgi:phosphopantothenoylcysteine synthetase/decarboxylase
VDDGTMAPAVEGNRKPGRRVVYAIVCGAPPAADVGEFVRLARADGWEVCVLATPEGRRWVDAEALERLTGYAVRSTLVLPGEDETPLPLADALLVAPATLNTVNKFRYGIADNFAVGVLCEARGLGIPIVLAPNVKTVLESHPAFVESLEELKRWGVHVMDQAPVPRGVRQPPWKALLEELDRLA